VLPGRAAEILAEPAWDALAAALYTVDASGTDPREALRTVAGWREVGTARSLSEVLVWRLHRLGLLDPAATGAPAGPTAPVRRRTRLSQHTPTAEASRRPTR
jgi:hypothetical protein